MLKSFVVGAFLLTATASFAAEPADSKDKMVCKRIKETTGWRLSNSSKVCKSKKEWEAENRETQRNSRDDTRGDN